MTLTCLALTHPGRVRSTNEDKYSYDSEIGLFIVADGMGGHNAGEVASALATETIRGFIDVTRREAEFTWPFGIDPRLSYQANRLATAIRLANRSVMKEGETRGAYTGMGTTVVAVLILGDRATFAGVGDSRLYSLLDGRLRQLTRDETWVTTLLQQDPQLDPVQLANHPMRHVLTNVVGAREDITVAPLEHELSDGELLLLCTDGLTDMLSDEQITAALTADRDLEAAARRLQEGALEAGGVDNVTTVLVRYQAGQDEHGRTLVS